MKPNYQRLSVLLFLLWGGYTMLYMMLPGSQCSLYVYDTFSLATSTLSSCVIFDYVSLSFSSVVMYISGCVFLFSRYYMALDLFYYRFTWILLSFVASMNVLILSGSLFILLLGWDGLGVSSFLLIMYYQSKESMVASFLTLLINRLGDIMIMSSMVVFTMMGSSFLFNYNPSFITPLMFLFAFAALTKSAQYPFCVWLPAAMAAPTPVSALVHSSTLVTAGVYILVRACSSNSMPEEVCNMLLFCGSITSFIGGSCAVYENDLKKLIALSTLSQLGIMMFSLGLGMYSLALLHLFTHAMFKALLFLVAGCILLLSYGVQDIRLLGGVTKSNPLLLIFMNVSAFCLMGLPFLSAYYSKHLILSYMLSQKLNIVSVMLMLLSTLLSSLYMLRLLKSLNWGPAHMSVTLLPFKSMMYYSPLFLLFFGSCFFGWMISALDTVYTISVFTPTSYNTLLNITSIFGGILGLLIYKSSGSKLFSTMFYMAPVWYNVNYFSNYIVHSLKVLDNGWLEPYTYISSMVNYLRKVNLLDKWPLGKMDFMAYFILGGGFTLMVWLWLN